MTIGSALVRVTALVLLYLIVSQVSHLWPFGGCL